MGKAKEFNFQTSPVATPAASTASYYVDTSGVLKFVNPAGTSLFANTTYGVGQTTTGALTGAGVGLGAPVAWLKVTGPSGQQWASPLFAQNL